MIQKTRETISELRSFHEAVIVRNGIKITLRKNLTVVEIDKPDTKLIFVFHDVSLNTQ
jgi:hypothetical protein